MSNNNDEESQIFDNEKKDDTYVIDNTELDNSKVYINKDNVLQSTKIIYEYLPLNAHCNKYDIEKWQDWFCIPNYYMNNNYTEGDKALIDIDTNDVSICYKPCYIDDINDSLIVKKGDKKQCIYKSSYLNGKYKDYTIFDPFSTICLLGSSSITIKDINNKGSYLYKLQEITNENDISNWNNEDYELVKDINQKKIIDNVIKNPAPFISSIITDIKKSKKVYELYIKNIIDTKLTETLIKSKIAEDINLFNNLLIDNDINYMTYLNKISDNYGIDYAFEVSKYVKNNSKNTNNELSDKIFTKDIKKYIDFALKYSCYVCFSKESLFYNNIINKSSIIKEDSIIKSSEREDICELPKIEIEEIKNQDIILKNVAKIIDKEDIVLFSVYNSIYDFFKSSIVIFNITILFIIIFFCIIFIADYNGWIYQIINCVNMIYIFMNEIMYGLITGMVYFQLYFFKYIIVIPLKILKRWIVSFASLIIIIAIILIMVGKQKAVLDIWYMFINIIISYIILIKNIFIVIYKLSIISFPFMILFIYTYFTILSNDYYTIINTDAKHSFPIINSNILINKFNFYKNNLIQYNANIAEYMP